MRKQSRFAWGLVAMLAVPAVALAVEQPDAQKKSAPSKAQKSQEKAKAIDPAADRMLREMTDYLAGLRSFKVESASTDEVVTKAGQKLEFAASSKIAVERPNRVRSEQIGTPDALTFTANGKTMSLYCKSNNTYASVSAPTTIDATIDSIRKEHGIDAPGADLLFSNPYDVLTEQVKSGKVIGRETIDGVLATHLAFQGETVDWQVWIKVGPEPLPLRYVITTKTVKSRPEFSVDLSHWEPNVMVDSSQFALTPPGDAKKVDAFPTSCGRTT